MNWGPRFGDSRNTGFISQQIDCYEIDDCSVRPTRYITCCPRQHGMTLYCPYHPQFLAVKKCPPQGGTWKEWLWRANGVMANLITISGVQLTGIALYLGWFTLIDKNRGSVGSKKFQLSHPYNVFGWLSCYVGTVGQCWLLLGHVEKYLYTDCRLVHLTSVSCSVQSMFKFLNLLFKSLDITRQNIQNNSFSITIRIHNQVYYNHTRIIDTFTIFIVV